MRQNELSAKIRELRELRRMADEIAAEIDGITDSIKQHMDAAQVDTLSGNDWKITYKTVTSSRLDTAAIKRYHADIAAKYTKITTTKRFLIA